MNIRKWILLGSAALLCLAFVIVKFFLGRNGDYVPPGPPTTTTGAPVPPEALKKPHLQTRHHFPDGHVGPAYVTPDGKVVRVPQ